LMMDQVKAVVKDGDGKSGEPRGKVK